MATIRKRGALQWEARIRRRRYPLQCRTFNTRAEAEAWARQTENEMDRGVFLSRVEAESTTLGEALERYLREITPKKKAPDRERTRGNAIRRRPLARRALAAIRGKDISLYIREREAEKAAANTIRLDLALLSHLYETCRSAWGMESLVNPVPLAKTARPKAPPGRTRRLRDGEEKALLDAAGSDFARVISFALETAMRRGEIAAMRWEHVDLARRVVRLPHTKNGEARSVPLSPAALALLGALARRWDGRVFGLTEEAITRRFTSTARAASCEDLRFHDLRHEATSRFFERTDLDVMEIRAITGHKAMQMLARYTHLRTDRLADRLAGARRK